MVTVLGGLTAVLVVLTLARRRDLALPLGVTAGIPLGTAASVAGNDIGIYAVVTVLVVAALPFQDGKGSHPGFDLLTLFASYATLITLTAPALFAGTPVLPPRTGIDEAILAPEALDYSVSNFAQVAYMLLGVATVMYLMRSPRLGQGFLVWAIALPVVLSFVKFVLTSTGLPWPDGFFDNATGVRYIDVTATGEDRFRGIFSEPSALAGSGIIACAFFLPLVLSGSRRQRWGSLAVVAMALVNVAVSTATTALVGGAVVATAAVAFLVGRFLFAGKRVDPYRLGAVFVALAGTLLVLVVLGGSWLDSAVAQVKDKLGSQSYGTRSGADRFSYHLLLDSAGLGLGLGSNRPSSFIPMMLSCVGAIGLALFVVAVVTILGSAWRYHEARPTIYAVTAMLIIKCVVGSDLSVPLLWLGLGLCANLARQRFAPRGDDTTTVATTTYTYPL